MKKDIRAYGYDRLKEEMEALGEKPFRAKQVYEWLHVKLSLIHISEPTRH